MFESKSPLRRDLYLKHYKQNSFLIFFPQVHFSFVIL